ncbi:MULTISPECIES: high-potential iron-sulfur protein [unclassified Caballeronia]|uniref:high-potential iron-sulfur protein n=1 Tax=unclassified Caballeronia TaxID=2646786 RepID=UPI0020292FC0|nr:MULTISPECIES: high-potential iron-sulfur protein [unclassified Caballeronia]MDR5773871.1 high-potential iron-sulfur protein [Caballeronia sp. LZ002]MDR5849306.1 high-potential iron-sulfur protein [Caballeronia sp. LZ003]
MKLTRRKFVLMSAGASASLWLIRADAAAAHLNETDPAAAAVGYREDAAKVDRTKYPNFAAEQSCGNCSLFQGKSTDAWGGCTLFGDKLVAGKGWCASYTNM